MSQNLMFFYEPTFMSPFYFHFSIYFCCTKGILYGSCLLNYTNWIITYPTPMPPTRAPLKMSAKTMANCTSMIAVAIMLFCFG